MLPVLLLVSEKKEFVRFALVFLGCEYTLRVQSLFSGVKSQKGTLEFFPHGIFCQSSGLHGSGPRATQNNPRKVLFSIWGYLLVPLGSV